MYKSRWRTETEGERAFERDPYSRHRNPYKKYGGDLDDSRNHRNWDDGFRSAQRRAEERREEQDREERRERQRQYEQECIRRQQEEEDYARRQAEEEQEELPLEE